MITSSMNQQVKKIIQLNQKTRARHQDGLFVAEGKKMFLEAPGDWVEKIYISEGCLKEGFSPEKKRADGQIVPVELVSDSVFRQMSDTCTPQGIMALVRIPVYSWPDRKITESSDGDIRFAQNHELYMVLEDMQDPGNMGTVFRTAEAAGFTGIILTEGCVDVTNPKVVRGTMGAVYRLPWYVTKDIVRARKLLAMDGIKCLAAVMDGEMDYDMPDYSDSCAFFVGNEGRGLSLEALACTDIKVSIPMCGRTESLNAAMAAGILMYEAFRQRRNKKGGNL